MKVLECEVARLREVVGVLQRGIEENSKRVMQCEMKAARAEAGVVTHVRSGHDDACSSFVDRLRSESEKAGLAEERERACVSEMVSCMRENRCGCMWLFCS